MLESEYKFPEEVNASLDGGRLSVDGPKGKLEREFSHPKVDMSLEGKKILIKSKSENKKTKAIIGTWKAIIDWMSKGVTKGWVCRLKLVYSHFPVKLKHEGDTLVVENFLGERQKRMIKIDSDVSLNIKGNEITISGADKEKVGQTAALIEQKVAVRKFDRRIFQDGIYKIGKTEVSEE
ncbi:MAG: 50S ribosomal protein L6 [Candidatus Micrarchaeota archaeon]|nr:50S ribosomal protein L6 [Candidatus Micrarchaeota archaeon]